MKYIRECIFYNEVIFLNKIHERKFLQRIKYILNKSFKTGFFK